MHSCKGQTFKDVKLYNLDFSYLTKITLFGKKRAIWINHTIWITPNVISLKRNQARHPACTAVENGRTFGDG